MKPAQEKDIPFIPPKMEKRARDFAERGYLCYRKTKTQ